MHNTLISELESLQPSALDAGLVFSGKASGRLIQGYAKPSAYTPAIDPNYLFHESSRDIIVWLMCPHQSRADPLYVFGPQLAARLHYPVFEVTGHGRLEFADLTGHLAVKDGNMVYEYGPLALAMRYGGILLLNEIDLTSPEVAAGLNTVLDGSPLCIAENGGELIAPHPMFRFVATANTNGSGDDTGLYQGAQRQNLAWLDRFVLCEIGYPAPDVEKALPAQRFPVLPEELSHKLVELAGEVRKLFMGEGDSQNLTSIVCEIDDSTRVQQGLYPLLGVDLSTITTLPFIHLEKPSNNPAGSKFWGATVSTQGLTLNWGRSGTVGQSMNITTKQCANNSPVQEMLHRTLKKLHEGYVLDPNSTFIPTENA